MWPFHRRVISLQERMMKNGLYRSIEFEINARLSSSFLGRPWLSGKNFALLWTRIEHQHLCEQIRALTIRRPGESRGPATWKLFKSLGTGFRRDDEVSSAAASIGDFPRTAADAGRDDDEAI